MKDFLWRWAEGIVSNIILFALIIPSYYIVVWIFPGLEYHTTARGRGAMLTPLIYTIGLFAAVAIAAVILFIMVAILRGAVMILLRRDDA